MKKNSELVGHKNEQIEELTTQIYALRNEMARLRKEAVQSSIKENVLRRQVTRLATKGRQQQMRPPCRTIGVQVGADEVDMSDATSSLVVSEKSDLAVKHFRKNVETGDILDYNLDGPVPEDWGTAQKRQKKSKQIFR